MRHFIYFGHFYHHHHPHMMILLCSTFNLKPTWISQNGNKTSSTFEFLTELHHSSDRNCYYGHICSTHIYHLLRLSFNIIRAIRVIIPLEVQSNKKNFYSNRIFYFSFVDENHKIGWWIKVLRKTCPFSLHAHPRSWDDFAILLAIWHERVLHKTFCTK